MMGLALRSEFQNSWPNNSRGKGLKDSMTTGILSTYASLQARYNTDIAMPVGKYFHALVNSQPIAVDDDLLDYVRTSVTNSITSFRKNILKKQGKKIVPETSIWNIKTHVLFREERNCQRPSSRRYFPSSDSHAAIVYAAQRGRKRTNDPYGTDIKSMMCTVGGGPYNEANTTSNYSFVKDGVVRNKDEWLANTFERGLSSSLSMNKIKVLEEILKRPIIVSKIVGIGQIASSVNNLVDRSPWTEKCY